MGMRTIKAVNQYKRDLKRSQSSGNHPIGANMETQQQTTTGQRKAMSLDKAQAAYKALLAKQKADREAAAAKVKAAKAREAKKFEVRNTRRKIIFYDALFEMYLEGGLDASIMQAVIDRMSEKNRAFYREHVPGADWTPNAETVAAMNEPPGEQMTLDQFKQELHVLAEEAAAEA